MYSRSISSSLEADLVAAAHLPQARDAGLIDSRRRGSVVLTTSPATRTRTVELISPRTTSKAAAELVVENCAAAAPRASRAGRSDFEDGAFLLVLRLEGARSVSAPGHRRNL
jgi:hypothetical protein